MTMFLRVLLFVLCGASHLFAATYHVSKGGSDANSCATAQGAYFTTHKLTIAAGLGCLAAGDTLYIHEGTYTEQITESAIGAGGGSWANPVRIEAVPGERVILRPTGGENVIKFPAGSTRAYVIFSRLILDGVNAGGGANGAVIYVEIGAHHLRFIDVEATNGDGNGVLAGGDHLEFLRMRVHRNGLFSGYLISNGMYLYGDDCLVEEGEYFNNEAAGIRLYDSDVDAPIHQATNNIVRRTRVYNNGAGFGLDGTSTSPAGAGIIIGDINNKAFNNEVFNCQSGIWAYTEADGVTIGFNTVYNVTGEGLAAQFYTTFPTLTSNIIRTASPEYVDYSGSNALPSSNLTGTDPQFVNAGANDFRLLSTSPARDTGTAISGVDEDYARVPRPQNGTVDKGAREFYTTTIPPPPMRLALANWEVAGVTPNGGIPARPTQCGATVLASEFGSGSSDATSGLQSRINSCTVGQHLLLGPGTFRLDSYIKVDKGITLRGSGAGQTILTKSFNGATRDFANGYIATDYNPVIVVGNSPFPEFQTSTALNLTTDAVQGQSSVTLASTTGLSPGMYVEVSEDIYSPCAWADKPDVSAVDNLWQVWACDRTVWARHRKKPGTLTVSTLTASNNRIETSAPHPFVVGDMVYLTGHTGTLVPAATDALYGIGTYYIKTVPTSTTFTLEVYVGTPTNAFVDVDITVDGAGGTVYAGKRFQDDFFPGPAGMTANDAPLGYYTRGYGRVSGEVKKIATIVGLVVTFTSPFTETYRVANSAQVAISDNAFVEAAGVENLSCYKGSNGCIRFHNAANSWAKDVEVFDWLGHGIHIGASFRVEVQGAYVREGAWPKPGGGGYAFALQDGTSECLIWNSIARDTNKNIVAQTGGPGCVIAYNYFDDSYIWDIPQSNTPWVEVGLNASHFSGPHHVLFEGNYSHNFDSDFTHGSAHRHTVLRNHLAGHRQTFTGMQNARAFGLAFGAREMTALGNVQGLSGQMSGWVFDAGTTFGGATGYVWKLGYDPVDFNQEADPNVTGTIDREGNYDYLTGTVQWSGGALTVPDSYFRLTAPPFFQTCPWPWVDSTGATKTYTLPARARYLAGTPLNTSADSCASVAGTKPRLRFRVTPGG